MKALSRFLALGAAVALAHLPATAAACNACVGKANDSAMAGAMNAAIYLMLACIGAMLAFVTAVGVVIVRRGQHPLPPHAQFRDINDQP